MSPVSSAVAVALVGPLDHHGAIIEAIFVDKNHPERSVLTVCLLCCAVCPPVLLWPAVEPWAGWFVIAAFAGILMWEQVWDLPGHAALSGEVLTTQGPKGFG